jgi:TctA family transporter
LRSFADVLREFHRVVRGATHEHWKLRRRIAALGVLTLTVDAIGTALMYGLEHDKQGSQITSVFTGFFWVTTQLLTVSSQMANPVSTGGRIVDIFLELCALTVVTALAGSFAAFLLKK